MRKPTLQLTWCAAALLCSAVLVNAFPKPSLVAKAWQLDFEPGKPRPVSIRDVNGQIQWYWYLTYEVQNNTAQERLFIPEISVATDEGDLVRTGKNVPAEVFEAIQQLERNPLLLSPIEIVGKLLLGADFAKEGVAIWPAFDHPVDQMDVFVAGLSGETEPVEHPLTKERVVMRKVLMLTFATPGSRTHPQRQAVLPRGEEWIMR